MLASVADSGPTLYQHWVKVSCLLGCRENNDIFINLIVDHVFYNNNCYYVQLRNIVILLLERERYVVGGEIWVRVRCCLPVQYG